MTIPSFELFPQLPVELRLQIWNLTLPSVNDKQGVCVLPRGLGPFSDSAKLVVRNPCSPLRAVNQESRKTALEAFPLTREYDEYRDILYVGNDTFYEFCDMCRESKWPSSITHLALAVGVADSGAWLPIALTGMHSIETISIVYPQTAGVVDRSADVPLPNTLPLVLRKFTVQERNATKVNADYLYDIHGRDMRIKWTKGIKKHLGFIKTEVSSGAENYEPPCWDAETNSVALDFQARCFEVSGEQ